MAQENDSMMDEVMKLLEVKPASSPPAAPGPDIPALRERLAILVCSGKCKEAICVNHTQTSEAAWRQRSHEALPKVRDLRWCQDDWNPDWQYYVIFHKSTWRGSKDYRYQCPEEWAEKRLYCYVTKELSDLSSSLALRCSCLLAVANSFLITAKHVHFSSAETHPSRDADGYPIAGLDEEPTTNHILSTWWANLKKNFLNFNIPHDRFRESTACRHKSTSDFKNSRKIQKKSLLAKPSRRKIEKLAKLKENSSRIRKRP